MSRCMRASLNLIVNSFPYHEPELFFEVKEELFNKDQIGSRCVARSRKGWCVSLKLLVSLLKVTLSFDNRVFFEASF